MLEKTTETVEPATTAQGLPSVEALLLQYEVEQFYYHEAALLDGRRYRDWLALFTPDTNYWMPLRRTKTSKDLDKEFTPRGAMALFDDDYEMLASRVKKLETGYAWSEDPPSRTRHLVTNLRIVSAAGDDLEAHTNFHLYRTRLNSEEDSWIGHREDKLRRVGGALRIASRSIFLEQTVLLSPNLSNFI